MDRRTWLSGATMAAASVIAAAAQPALAGVAPFAPPSGPRRRVLYINDLSGDIDGLFATVHAVLSPTIDLRGIVGTSTNQPGESVAKAAANAREMLSLMGRSGQVQVFEGCETRFGKPGGPPRSAGVQAIIDEAMRTDSKLPLFVTVGGGLTEVASALAAAPAIAARMTLVWIGGGPADGAGDAEEYNFNIDCAAMQYIFNDTKVPIWQIPDTAYRTCMVSATELEAYVAPCGAIGQYLYRKLFEMADMMGKYGFNTGETWTLGDSPLVLVTALNDWVPSRDHRYERTGSSQFDTVPTPQIESGGRYAQRADGRPIRVYRTLDARMMLSDFFAKLSVNFR